MIVAALLQIGLVASVGFRYVASQAQCELFNSYMGATFNIADLRRVSDEPSYMVTDGDIPCTTKTVEQNFTYVFNICGTVSSSSTLGLPAVCSKMDGLNTAGAIQIDKRIESNPDDDYCFMVGAYSDTLTKPALLDQMDPSKGIYITYYGTYCHHPVTQRQFRIELQCADHMNPVPTSALEYEHCAYTITVPSIYGCPLECPVANRHLCGGNGHCAYDSDKKGARCFCNHGYSGSSCVEKVESAESSSTSSALLGLIITLFVIIGTLVVGILLMIRQLSAYKEDLTNYRALRGDETETV